MDFWRQNDIVSQQKLDRYPFILIGAGGIGSVVGLVLVKMGVRNLTVYDPDVVEDHNLPNQTYRISDLGKPKVEALAAICREFAGVDIEPCQQEFPVPSMPEGIVINGVDSMAARQAIWDGAIKLNPRVKVYIEARMGAQEGRIYTVTPPDSRYEGSLYSDEEASELPCTARATGYNAFFLAGLLVSQVKKFVMGESTSPEILFDLVSSAVVLPE